MTNCYMPGVLWTDDNRLQFTLTNWSDSNLTTYNLAAGAAINWYYYDPSFEFVIGAYLTICSDETVLA